VSFTQSAFIHVCGRDYVRGDEETGIIDADPDDHCGTFLEVHRQNGSPVDSEETVLSEMKLAERSTSGMKTTTVPLTYGNDPKKVLCDFAETVIREGTLVIIREQAPRCCCPKKYNDLDRVGRYMCPSKPGSLAPGPFAGSFATLEDKLLRDAIQTSYPFCPLMEENEDAMMCSRLSSKAFSMDSYQEAAGEFQRNGFR
jgi:hypothetical protein